MNKKIASLLVMGMLSVYIAGCNVLTNTEVDEPKEEVELSSNTNIQAEEKDEVVNTMVLSDEDTEIEITGVEMAKDYEGKDALIVKYNYTNKKENPNTAMMNVYMEAFQNGKEIQSIAILMNNKYNDKVFTMKGITQKDCWYTFTLSDMSEVTLFVQTDIIFGEKAEYTINLENMRIVRK